jgi:hypothetical protein
MADVTRAAIIAPTIAPTTDTVITTRAYYRGSGVSNYLDF